MRIFTRLAPLLAAAALGLGWLSPPSAAAASEPSGQSDHDPLEGMNRKIFWFNDHVDTYVLVPVATAWDTILPARVKQCVSNFFQNLRFPIVAGNDLLQAKPL